MTNGRGDGWITFEDPKRRSATRGPGSAWPVLAIMAVGALVALSGVLGLLGVFGAASTGADGVYLVRLVLGAGLVMRKELARRVYLAFAIIALVLVLLGSVSSSSSAHLLDIALAAVTVGLLVHPAVKRAFD